MILLDFFIDDKSLYYSPTFVVSAALDLSELGKLSKNIVLRGRWQKD